MLKKNERLKRSEFSRFFSSGIRYHSKAATLIHTINHRRQVAVVVSKKVSPKAVKRNKLRRRIYAIARQEIDKGVYIFIMKPYAATLPYQTLKSDIINLVSKVKK